MYIMEGHHKLKVAVFSDRISCITLSGLLHDTVCRTCISELRLNVMSLGRCTIDSLSSI